MNNPFRSYSTCAAAAIAAALLFAAAHAAPPQVNAEPMDLDADINAKIFKEKARQASRNSQSGGSGDVAGGSSSDCGSVNINSNDKKSNSGIKDMFGKQSTTIVTGPVINMAKCK